MRRPPPLARWLLERLLPSDLREEVLSDLEACWRARGGDGDRPVRAAAWYWSQALRTLAPVAGERIRRRWHESPGWGTAVGLRHDVAFALRQLRRHAGVGLVVAGTLALGIGANTAIFSVVHAVLLRPLPYEDPEGLVVVTEEVRGTADPRNLSGPDFADLRSGMEAIRDAAVLGETTIGPLGGAESPEHVKTLWASANVFDVLGVEATLGRTFVAEDGIPIETPEGVEPPPGVAVISHGLWRRSFGGDPDVVGRVVEVWGSSFEIVGVLPEGFRLVMPPELNVAPDVEVVRGMRVDFRDASRGGQWFRTVGRLAPGFDLDGARAAVDAFSSRLRERVPLHAERATRVRVASLPERVAGSVRGPLLLLMGAVGLVLLIACANAANLLLARSTARAEELAVRSALGAGRGRVVRQLLTESAVLVGLGTGAGVGLAVGGIRLLHAVRPPELHRLEAVSLNGQVLLFAVGAAALTTLAAGLAPALHGMALSRRAGLGERGGTGPPRRVQTILAGGEIALSVILLVGAGLLIRTFAHLQDVPLGFDPQGVATVTVTQPITTVEDRRATEAELLREARSVPGVVSAGIVFPLPMNGVYERTAQYALPGREHEESGWSLAYFRTVSPGYFETMEIELLRGRRLTRADENPDVPVTVVDERFARSEWPGEDPVGKRIWVRNMRPDTVLFEVVGVVEHVPQGDHTDARPTLYFPRIHYLSHEVSLVARTAPGAANAGAGLLARVRSGFPGLPADLSPMEEYVSRSLAPTRFLLVLMEVFAGVALALAAVGLYGVLAYTVRRQTRELGVRLTLGAEAFSLVWLVVRRGARITAVGAGSGLAFALLLGRALEAQLYQVSPRDPAVLFSAVAVVLAVSLMAALLPGLRAASVDPAEALRVE